MQDNQTLIELFYDKEISHADKVFLRQPFGDTWRTYTWAETGQMARKIASAIRAKSLAPKSNIGLVSKNCSEWIIADLAIMMAGHVSVPLYPTLSGKQIAQVLDIGDVKMCFIGKLDAFEDMSTGIPSDMPIIKFPHYKGTAEVNRGESWEELLKTHQPLEEVDRPKLDDLSICSMYQ